MTGKIKLSVKNRHITFNLELERNITILTGDSGTGKTKLVNMIRDYSELGKSSGVTLKCDKNCIVLFGTNWEHTLSNTKESVIFVEESTPFLKSYDFAKAIQNTDNYYVFVTREPLPQIAYSIAEIKEIVKNGNKPKFNKPYKNISIRDISKFDYDFIIIEDSRAGFELYEFAAKNYDVQCISSYGKSGLLTSMDKHKNKKILVIADAAALGSEIRELVIYKEISNNKIDFFLPESFEWLVLKSQIFNSNDKVKTILKGPSYYIESRDFFSWEQYFNNLLEHETVNSPKLKYNKNKLASGYKTEVNAQSIINAMKK